ncbi:MAG: hypothetical protein AAF234_00290 [Pseudomonadota bacterium]
MRFLIVVLAVLMPASVLAQGRVLADYTTRISAQDKVNSVGDRLETAAAILRQDRANYHRFDQPDAEDEGDDVFDDRHERGRFERLMSRGVVRPDTARAIINGTPLLRVTVYATRMDVEILEP